MRALDWSARSTKSAINTTAMPLLWPRRTQSLVESCVWQSACHSQKASVQIGDLVSIKAVPVPDTKSECVNLHKASGIGGPSRSAGAAPASGSRGRCCPAAGCTPGVRPQASGPARLCDKMRLVSLGVDHADRDHHRSVESVQEVLSAEDPLLRAKGLPTVSSRSTQESPRAEAVDGLGGQ